MFVMSTSERCTSLPKTALPSACFKSSVRLFLFRFCTEKPLPVSSAGSSEAERSDPRARGASIRTTSAPWSARYMELPGPAMPVHRSMTRIPSRIGAMLEPVQSLRIVVEHLVDGAGRQVAILDACPELILEMPLHGLIGVRVVRPDDEILLTRVLEDVREVFVHQDRDKEVPLQHQVALDLES